MLSAHSVVLQDFEYFLVDPCPFRFNTLNINKMLIFERPSLNYILK